MSLLNFTVCCDWPGCGASVCMSNYPEAFRDCDWAARYLISVGGNHLCSEHRYKTWTELDRVVKPNCKRRTKS